MVEEAYWWWAGVMGLTLGYGVSVVCSGREAPCMLKYRQSCMSYARLANDTSQSGIKANKTSPNPHAIIFKVV